MKYYEPHIYATNVGWKSLERWGMGRHLFYPSLLMQFLIYRALGWAHFKNSIGWRCFRGRIWSGQSMGLPDGLNLYSQSNSSRPRMYLWTLFWMVITLEFMPTRMGERELWAPTQNTSARLKSRRKHCVLCDWWWGWCVLVECFVLKRYFEVLYNIRLKLKKLVMLPCWTDLFYKHDDKCCRNVWVDSIENAC